MKKPNNIIELIPKVDRQKSKTIEEYIAMIPKRDRLKVTKTLFVLLMAGSMSKEESRAVLHFVTTDAT